MTAAAVGSAKEFDLIFIGHQLKLPIPILYIIIHHHTDIAKQAAKFKVQKTTDRVHVNRQKQTRTKHDKKPSCR